MAQTQYTAAKYRTSTTEKPKQTNGERPKYRNTAILHGRVGREPKQFATRSGRVCLSFGVATERSVKNEKTGEWKTYTTWTNVKAWCEAGKVPEVNQGDWIELEGSTASESYKDKDGNDRNWYGVVADTKTISTTPAKHDDDTPF